jgi:hypothetical protein
LWIGPPARPSCSPPGSAAPSGSTWVSCAQDRYRMLVVPEGRISGKITEKEHILPNFKLQICLTYFQEEFMVGM